MSTERCAMISVPENVGGGPCSSDAVYVYRES